MPKKRPTPEQIVTLLRQIELATSQGKSIAIVCREAGLSDARPAWLINAHTTLDDAVAEAYG